jgi:polar amino acid transport system substrate-binding protein
VRSRADIWLALQRGELDVATSGVATDERRRYAFFVPYLYLRNKLIVPIELAPDLRSLDDFQRLPGARLGDRRLRPRSLHDGMLKILRGQGRVPITPTMRHASRRCSTARWRAPSAMN